MQFCKPSQAVENKIGFVACSPRSFLHINTLHQPDETGKKAGEMTHFIQNILPHPPRSAHVE
jgi:hypothetical protein